MAYITHMNYTNEDGYVYCCLRNKVVLLNHLQTLNYCASCTMFKGLHARKVSCRWEDARALEDPHVVIDPYLEHRSMQRRKIESRPTIVEAVQAEAGRSR